MALTKANGLAIVQPKIESATGKSLSSQDLVLLGALLDGLAAWIAADEVVTATGADPQGGTISVTGGAQ